MLWACYGGFCELLGVRHRAFGEHHPVTIGLERRTAALFLLLGLPGAQTGSELECPPLPLPRDRAQKGDFVAASGWRKDLLSWWPVKTAAGERERGWGRQGENGAGRLRPLRPEGAGSLGGGRAGLQLSGSGGCVRAHVIPHAASSDR